MYWDHLSVNQTQSFSASVSWLKKNADSVGIIWWGDAGAILLMQLLMPSQSACIWYWMCHFDLMIDFLVPTSFSDLVSLTEPSSSWAALASWSLDVSWGVTLPFSGPGSCSLDLETQGVFCCDFYTRACCNLYTLFFFFHHGYLYKCIYFPYHINMRNFWFFSLIKIRKESILRISGCIALMDNMQSRPC